MRTIHVDGMPVQVEEIEGKRLWRCTCVYFNQRLPKSGADGSYCPHIAVAILECIRDGSIDPRDSAARQFETFVGAAAGHGKG